MLNPNFLLILVLTRSEHSRAAGTHLRICGSTLQGSALFIGVCIYEAGLDGTGRSQECHSRGGEPVETALRTPPVVSGRGVPGPRRRRTCPAHTLRPPLRGRPGACGGVPPNCGGWTIPRRTSCAQLEMPTHRCPSPRVKCHPHKTGHAECRRGRRGVRTPPEDAGGDLTDAPVAARHLLPRP